jgi:superoxide dismutase, Fe-Mn family
VQDEGSGVLEIVTTKDQDIVPKGKKPLLGVDMWEHAYYLQYLNNKKDDVSGIWNVINWKVVEKRLTSTVDSVYGEVVGLAASLREIDETCA